MDGQTDVKARYVSGHHANRKRNVRRYTVLATWADHTSTERKSYTGKPSVARRAESERVDVTDGCRYEWEIW